MFGHFKYSPVHVTSPIIDTAPSLSHPSLPYVCSQALISFSLSLFPSFCQLLYT
ncbi:unnamed protein product [Periconia digitata]|uniref:Uncharacterized protein n=1 Tax=Periconia digitata TaxID=1303443 RepID=A0A9W4U2V1_9PLEO|nr:unnamed protein product [Periconia digitata]